MRIESGPAKTDALWHIGRAVLFLAFAAYFVYDGSIAWPNANKESAIAKLRSPSGFDGQVTWDQLGERPTMEEFEALRRSNPSTREEVVKALGEPQYTQKDDEFFMSRYGYGQVSLRVGDRVAKMNWVTWKKTKAEIQAQFYWAILPALPGLYFLWRFFKAIRLHVTVDDEGMTYDNKRIAFSRMSDLRDYNPKGWIDLYFQAGDKEQRIRLDNEKVAAFDEIVDAICEKKGFRNEVREYAEAKAREELLSDEEPTQFPDEEMGTPDEEAPERKDEAGHPTDRPWPQDSEVGPRDDDSPDRGSGPGA